MAKSNNLIGLAGEYYVCAELCRQGLLALITPKNNPLFDIVATDPMSNRAVSIQVKTMSTGNDQGWKLGKNITIPKNNPHLFVILVNMKPDGTNDFYIYPFDELAERIRGLHEHYLSIPKRDGTSRKDTDFLWFNLTSFNENDHSKKDNWSILGF